MPTPVIGISHHPPTVVLTAIGAGVALFLLLSFVARVLRRDNHLLAQALLSTRNLVLPAGLIYLLLHSALELDPRSNRLRAAESLFWIMVLWVSLLFLRVMVFARAPGGDWRARVPGLFIDLVRAAMVALGAALIIAGIWERDLGGFLATLGIGSIVLGLALQDTLGNLFAGIAILFERPFTVGDWIQVGETVGTVLEITWRAVRIQTRSLDMVVVPNSVLGKEKITNFSRPTVVHGVQLEVGLSYKDPPNKVKRVLVQTALATRGIRHEGIIVRTIDYREYKVVYQVRFFIDDYDRLPDIQEEFMTQVWYAMRRNGLTIPYPVRTVNKTEIPYVAPVSAADDMKQVLRGIEIFAPLSMQEIEILSSDSILQHFAKGERIIYQGDSESSLYVVKSGSVVVSVGDDRGIEKEVGRLARGEIFGEMALLTGESRSANVSATEDTEVVVIYKDAMKNLLLTHPQLADRIGAIVEARHQGLDRVIEEQRQHAGERIERQRQTQSVVARMRDFFGI